MFCKRIRWAGNVAHMGEISTVYRICVGKLKGRNHLEDIIDGMMILQWILKEWGMRLWTGFIWLRILISGGLL
jgi:hypothetical protein